MSTTVQTLINRSLRILGRLGSGRSPTADETADCLVALNAMLESWRNERLMTYSMVEKTLTLTIGTASYTIGSGGNINTTFPVKVSTSFMRENNIDYLVRSIDEKQWDSLPVKSTTGNIIKYLYYNPTFPLGVLNLYPVPSAANVLHLTLWTPLASFTAATDAVTLPPGYDRAITTNLALEVAPEYGESVSELVMLQARESKAAIKRINLPSMETTTELSRMYHPRRTNIESDGA